ncbi:low affinity immunoglobulin gamma Fc region receptor II-a-like [Phascolarctos cinereus]
MDQSRTGHLVQLPHFAGPPRAVLTLEPPWFNVLRGDNVTLTFEGHDSMDQISPSTRNPMPSHLWLKAGIVECLEFDRLLLQAERSEFMEGDTMILRYHSWKSKRLHKVTYDYNDKALKFDNQTFNCTVFQVNHAHNGSYHEILPSIRNYSNQCQR